MAGFVTSAGVASLLVLSLSACGGKQAPETKPTVSVEVAKVTRAKLERKVTAEAVLYALDQKEPRPALPVNELPKLSSHHPRGGHSRAASA